MTRRDPVEAESDGTRDLYDVSTWEPRTALDRLATRVYRGVLVTARWLFILLGITILVVQFLLGGIGATFANDPFAIGLVALSVIPAFLLVGYIYVTDITSPEPLELLVGTFVLGVVFAGFAAIVNTLLSFVQILPIIGTVLFFYLVVGPIEETVKLLAVRLYPYRSDSFDAVIDGTVYGAVAGLGFATIENALYITRQIGVTPGGSEVIALGALGAVVVPVVQINLGGLLQQALNEGGGITAVRALAGPGHVIYSAFAGYYLGLAKFNPENAGPIVAKGLIIAAFIHATYNTLVGVVPGIVSVFFPNVSLLVIFFGFVVVYDGLFGLILVRKLGRYRAMYRAVHSEAERKEVDLVPEQTEFDPDR
ncbi:PrsW family intramembrane metalloprotease [Halorarius litoreus]|uniref:PrsW family intramembrane metalloprotease n=1 Tax=Halorarius litoreus TaxID=2962676 RepID=UPI0020CB6E94|nr:PrsW family glutamic-type intramembrane protease [Halorarius litoreus]